jgi:hypothetical protein
VALTSGSGKPRVVDHCQETLLEHRERGGQLGQVAGHRLTERGASTPAAAQLCVDPHRIEFSAMVDLGERAPEVCEFEDPGEVAEGPRDRR